MNIAIVGATGNVGRKTLEVFDKKNFKFDDLYLVASEKSAGKKLEDLLSGRGISRLYENFSGVLNSPEDVVRLCKDNDQNAIKAIDTFIDSLAIAISDMALTYMPGRGIFVAGGLMRTIYNFIDHERFINRFIGQRKSMHQELLQKMPIGIITREMTCLHGNLAFLTSQLMKS